MLLTVLLREAVVLTTASPTPQPTTHRPPWDTTAPPFAATLTTVQREGDRHRGDSDPASEDQSLKNDPDSSVSSEAAWSEADTDATDSMVLGLDVYDGQPTLVYKLAPGAIFAGVKSPLLPLLPTHHVDEWQRTSGGGRPRKPERMPPSKGVSAGWVTPPLPVHSLKHPLPVPRRPPHRVISLSSLRARLATLSTAGLGAVRAVRLIFMLMQYLGFLPHLPGLPKYEDPVHLRPSIHYTLPRGDASEES